MRIQRDIDVRSIEDLLGKTIVTEDGKKLGHVADIDLSRGPEYRIRFLLYGPYGILHRLHVLHPFANRLGMRTELDRIAWQDVLRIGRNAITVRHHPSS